MYLCFHSHTITPTNIKSTASYNSCVSFSSTVALASSIDPASNSFQRWPATSPGDDVIRSALDPGLDSTETGRTKRRILLGKRPRDDDNELREDRLAGDVSSKRKTMLGKRKQHLDDEGEPRRISLGPFEVDSFAAPDLKRKVMLGKRPVMKSVGAAPGNFMFANRNQVDSIENRGESVKRRIMLGKKRNSGLLEYTKRRILLGKRTGDVDADGTKRIRVRVKRQSYGDSNRMKRRIMLGKRPGHDVMSYTKRKIMLGKRPLLDMASYMKRRIMLGKRLLYNTMGDPMHRVLFGNPLPPHGNSNDAGRGGGLFNDVMSAEGSRSNLATGNGRVRLGRDQDNVDRYTAVVKRPFGSGSYRWDRPSATNVREERRKRS